MLLHFEEAPGPSLQLEKYWFWQRGRGPVGPSTGVSVGETWVPAVDLRLPSQRRLGASPRATRHRWSEIGPTYQVPLRELLGRPRPISQMRELAQSRPTGQWQLQLIHTSCCIFKIRI